MMGSLPNLHELGRENPGFRAVPALGHLCGGLGDDRHNLSQDERNRILHRHSTHNKIKNKGNGQDVLKTMVDDFTLEHMAGYSPISTRSTRHLHQIRRKDSLSSSIGATSVRRLLAVVRNGPSSGTDHRTRPITRHSLLANLIVLCATHMTIIATYLPYLALQSSLSVWSRPDEFISVDINIGSLLLAAVHFTSSTASMLSPMLQQCIGSNNLLVVSYLLITLHYGIHLYPALYLLIPSGLVFGIALGLMTTAHTSSLMTIACKLGNQYGIVDEDDEVKVMRRTCLIRRVARAFKGAHDFGLIVGSIVSAVIITYTVNRGTAAGYNNYTQIGEANQLKIICSNATVTESNCSMYQEPSQSIYDYSAFLDEIFDTVEGTRLCGAQACPSSYLLTYNTSTSEQHFEVLPTLTVQVLAGVYTGLCFLAMLLAVVGLDRLNLYVYQDPSERPQMLPALRGVREAFSDVRIQLSVPLAFFIGLQQVFIYADFSKSYVVCTLGVHRLNLVFLAMGLLQSIAACTLSMLLRSIRRYYVVAVGFTFHACLLMVLMLWKPIEDDPALFYVISAAWGVCNAIWEMLSFSLLTGQYADRWEAAFAITASFRFFGMSVAFVFHGLLCNYVKLYGLAFCMLVSVISFTYLEIKLENMRKMKNISRL